MSFTVIATDSASPPSSVLTSTATVSVSLIDINDNTPQFQPHPTQYSVEENAPNGTFVGNITATDRDSGRFGEITYSMQVTNDDQSLTIDSKTVRSFSFLSKTPCQSQFDLPNHGFFGDKYLIKYSLIGIASRFLQFGKF